MEPKDLIRDDGSQRFGSLFERCSCGSIALRIWFQVPEFVEKIDQLSKQGVYLCDENLLPIMKEIYDRKLEEKREARRIGIWYDFEFGQVKAGMRRMRKAIESRKDSST